MDGFANAAVTFSGGGFNQFASALVKKVIDMGLLDENVRRLRSTYSEKADATDLALREHFGDMVDYTKPSAATTSGSAFRRAGWISRP